MKEVYYKMGEFSVDVMPDATPIEHLLKLKHEAQEAIDEPGDIVEYADCLLALYAAAYKSGFTYEELRKAGEEKIEVLKTRKWRRIEDGTYQHIKKEDL